MALIPYNKPPKIHDDHIKELNSRGLIIKDEKKANHLLEKISYYRLSGYWYPMLKEPKSDHIFKPKSTLNNAFQLYCFDRELRKLISNEVEKIEIAIRAKMINVLSLKHGAFWYCDNTLSKKQSKNVKSIERFIDEYERTDEIFIREFKAKYSNPLPPCWMMFEISSFGSLSMLYDNLKAPSEKRIISNSFGLDEKTFASWLHSLVYVRNVCAHHSRLWNRYMTIAPKLPISPANDWINITILPPINAGGLPQSVNNRLYIFLCMILYLINSVNKRNRFKLKLFYLLRSYKNVDVRAMGFPDGWENEPLWKWNEVDTIKNKTKYLIQKIFS